MSMGYTHANYLCPGVTAPNPHALIATAHRPSPLKAGARSTGRGVRVEAVDSFEESFVWTLQPWNFYLAAKANQLHNMVSLIYSAKDTSCSFNARRIDNQI